MFNAKIIKGLKEEIVALQEGIEKYKKESDMYHKRCIDLEDAFKTEHGINVRREVTEVIADYTKLEMVIILAAVSSLISKGGNPDDLKIYIALIEKIRSFVKDMDEPKEGNLGIN